MGEKMTTLVIHAPDYRVKDGAKSFEQVLADGIGKGYAIYEKYKSKLPEGSKVILLRNDKNQRRAEGYLINLLKTGIKTDNGIWRYDVHINGLREVLPYSYSPAEKLNRCGIAVIEGGC